LMGVEIGLNERDQARRVQKKHTLWRGL